jgi:hypothetical protein
MRYVKVPTEKVLREVYAAKLARGEDLMGAWSRMTASAINRTIYHSRGGADHWTAHKYSIAEARALATALTEACDALEALEGAE